MSLDLGRQSDEPEEIGVNEFAEPAIGELIARRISRRAALAGGAAAAALAPLDGHAQTKLSPKATTLTFVEVKHGSDERHHVAAGYDAAVLVRWGDPLARDAPAFDPANLTAAAQEQQFGYNCDFVAYLPLPYDSRSSTRGLLAVNNEYTDPELMFANFGSGQKLSLAQAEIDMSAHGLSIVEIRRENGRWRTVPDSPFNRRVSARTTAIRLGGPAAGHPRLRTSADPTGTRAIGTMNNCGGGWTPWGTVLSGEENFNGYFQGDASKVPEAANYRRLGVQAQRGRNWGEHDPRFDVEKEPNEPNRFGWVVEVDPYEPNSMPVKRTALGRFKHEAAVAALTADGRVAIYTGDDERFEYIYRFVSRGKFDPRNRAANRDLLDDGTLAVARFDADGSVSWLPLVFGEGPLTAANGFGSQADVLIDARRAGDLLGATPMDRPEDVDVSPVTGRVYAVMTYNERRKPASDASARERANPANPRADNRWGHIVELIPPVAGGKADHGAARYRWEFFLKAGDPRDPAQATQYAAGVSADGWLAAPDNIAFDPRGRMWIATDGMPGQAGGVGDGLYATDAMGPGRALTKQFFRVPAGAETCGPCFTPDGRTLFVAVQHPGEDKDSTFDHPSTRWPDFKAGVPPRPSVVAITRIDGGEVGS